MRFQVICKAVEDIVDQGFIGEIARFGPEQVEPPRPLAVIGEETVDIGADNASVR